jgi:hypothetical protein
MRFSAVLRDRSLPSQSQTEDKVLQKLKEADTGAVDAGWVCCFVLPWNYLYQFLTLAALLGSFQPGGYCLRSSSARLAMI